MFSENAILLPIIVAGLMNGSFAIPARHLPQNHTHTLWFYHSILGLGIIPWIMLAAFWPEIFQHYLHFPPLILACVLSSGLVFGLGQICFVHAISTIGMALSFAINLGLDVTIGSLFVVFYQSQLMTEQGFFVMTAIVLILSALTLSYHAGKIKTETQSSIAPEQNQYITGWILAAIAGVASGFQNISFFWVAFHAHTIFEQDNAFWVWPPFLIAAAIPMAWAFLKKMQASGTSFHSEHAHFLTLKNLGSLTVMGLFFTGSLAIYSGTMGYMTPQQRTLGWPAFTVSIILASQIWGLVYKENPNTGFKIRLYQLISLFFLVGAIFILASHA